MPDLRKLNEAWTNLQASVKVVEDSMESFGDLLDKMKEDLIAESNKEEEEEE